MRVAAYLRCSTDGQSVESQRRDIEEYLAARKPTKVVWYEDAGESGAKTSRPALDRLMADIRKRRFDTLVCFKLDRLSRSLVHAVQILDELRRNDVKLVSLRDGITFDGPFGSLLFALVAGLAELERDAIRERVKAGLRAARARGVRLGRAPAELDTDQARRMRDAGRTMAEVAKHFGVSPRTLRRRLNGRTKSSPESCS